MKRGFASGEANIRTLERDGRLSLRAVQVKRTFALGGLRMKGLELVDAHAGRTETENSVRLLRAVVSVGSNARGRTGAGMSRK
jgi:hypothetical protein